MNEKEMQICHSILLEMLVLFHDFCTKHNLVYYLAYGTMLGAVRHKGFVPWDLDIDVTMPRKDYEKMHQYIQSELPKKYFVQNETTDPLFFAPKTKILYTNAIINSHLRYSKSFKEGLALDISPLDIPPDKFIEKENQKKKIQFLTTLLSLKVKFVYPVSNDFDSNYIWKHFKRCILLNTIRIILKPFSHKYIMNVLIQVIKKYNHFDNGYLCSMISPYDYYKEIMEKSVYGKGTEIQFEGLFFMGPDMPHQYLSKLYGDYYCLPTYEERFWYRHLGLKIIDC